MTISFASENSYSRYQVRVMRHGKAYSKCFSCKNGKRKALVEAKNYEKELTELLNAKPMTNAGRLKYENKEREPYVIWLEKWKNYYVAVSYRKKSGHWGQVLTSIKKHGLLEAIRLTVEKANKHHNPHPDYVAKKRMPSKIRVRIALEKI